MAKVDEEKMTKFESDAKLISFSQERVYNKLSDLNNLEEFIGQLPAEKVKDLSFDADTLSFSMSPVGQLVLKVVERKPCESIQLSTTESPLSFSVWLHLVSVSDTECELKVVVGAVLSPFMKAMIEKLLKDGLVKVVDLLAMIQY